MNTEIEVPISELDKSNTQPKAQLKNFQARDFYIYDYSFGNIGLWVAQLPSKWEDTEEGV